MTSNRQVNTKGERSDDHLVEVEALRETSIGRLNVHKGQVIRVSRWHLQTLSKMDPGAFRVKA